MSPPFYADIADAPNTAAPHWVETADGLRLRIVLWPGAGRGTVLVFTGRAEYAEKYGPTVKDLTGRGFSVVVIEWRGQGLSTRPNGRTDFGHVGNFSEYQLDVAAVLAHPAVTACPRPFHLLAHSMGGAIGLRALIEGLDVSAAVFSAPMWGIGISPVLRPFAVTIAGLASAIGFRGTRIPGTGTRSYVLDNEYEKNCLTSDPDTYQRMRRALETHGDLGLGGPTFGWLLAALRECQDLSREPPPREIAVLLGTAEGVVDPNAIRARMARPGHGSLKVVEGVRHEILMETPKRRAAFWEVFDAATAG